MYRRLMGARQRAKREPSYRRRGIKFDDALIRNIRDACAWAREQGGFGPGESLDRADNDGDYTMGNLRIVDARTQCLNRSCTLWLTIGGITLTLSDWVRATGVVPYGIAMLRIYSYRWDPLAALLIPVNGLRRCGVPRTIVEARLADGCIPALSTVLELSAKEVAACR
jgi:hypothetical protein